MIKTLRIQNYLFIKDQTIEFFPDMNVFIGESGVGKSLIINILMIPEKKPKKDIIGKWGSESIIDIEVNKAGVTEYIQFVIGSKLVFKINNEVVTQKRMREYWLDIVDVHSQGNYQMLYDSQLEIIDSFMTASEKKVKSNYLLQFEDYFQKKEVIKELDSKLLTDSEKDLYEYHLIEIEKVSPKENEDDELFVTLKQIKNRLEFEQSVEKVRTGLEEAGSGISASSIAADKLAHKELISKEIAERLNSLLAEQEDLLWELTKLSKQDNYENPDQIESRLSELESLKTKFKRSLQDLLEYQEKIKDMLDNREYYQAKREKLAGELEQSRLLLVPLANDLTETRKKVLSRVLADIEKTLKTLRLDKTELSYSLKKKESFDEQGNDVLEILIKVNVGTHFATLRELSGGETSRVLLALKAVLLSKSAIGTYVFDEIDSGVSGDIAFKVMEVMHQMANNAQLLVITHLPMVAVNTNVLFKIKKIFLDQQTSIEIDRYLKQEDIIKEVSMLVTDKSTEAADAYVRSLARKHKSN